MTPTQRYPATLPPQAQETIYDFVHKIEAYLVQREVSRQELERQNAQLSASLQAERRLTDDLRRALAESERELGAERAAHAKTADLLSIVRKERDEYGAGIMRAAGDFTRLERELGEAQAAHEETKKQIDDARKNALAFLENATDDATVEQLLAVMPEIVHPFVRDVSAWLVQIERQLAETQQALALAESGVRDEG